MICYSFLFVLLKQKENLIGLTESGVKELISAFLSLTLYYGHLSGFMYFILASCPAERLSYILRLHFYEDKSHYSVELDITDTVGGK